MIILGDLNAACHPIDHWDTVNMEHFEEDPRRKWMDAPLVTWGVRLSPIWRPLFLAPAAFHKSRSGFSPAVQWSGVPVISSKVLGLTMCWGTGLFTDTFQSSFLLPELMASNHCPMGAVFSVSVYPQNSMPLCTCLLPEFASTQLKTLSFLVPY